MSLRVGSTNRVLTTTTNADGRAQFDGLRVGDSIRVRSVVDSEMLESQPFDMPAQGGVRMVLVAGVGAGLRSFADTWPPSTEVPSAPRSVPAPDLSIAAAGNSGSATAPSGTPITADRLAVTRIRLAVALVALFVVAGVLVRRRTAALAARDARPDAS